MAGLNGLLVVDKPRGPTSHDVVARARRYLGTRAVGHAGTLDPMASGVLVLLVGEATKLAAYLSLDDKSYRATVEFGRSTDTGDAEGRTTAEATLPAGFPDAAALEAALGVERSRTEQTPPAVSAISVDGERSYRRARRGETVILPPRPVIVHDITVVSSSPEGTRPSVTLELRVSKGYYVRSLARDLGEHFGVPACLAALVRTASGPYTLPTAAPWPLAGSPPLLPLEEAACTALPSVRLTEEGAARARMGKALVREHFEGSPPGAPVCAWLGPDGSLVALGRPAETEYRVVRGFAGAEAPINSS